MSLIERKRQLVRDELAEAALHLIAFQGFEETTIDQMAAAAGVSRRTFFRYFQSKEDVIVEFLSDVGRKLSTALQARPATEAPDVALRQALHVFMDKFWEHPEKSSRLTGVMVGTSALLARYLERQVAWKATMTTELARRMGRDPATDLHPAILVAVAFAAFDTALTCWAADPTKDLNALVEECFALAF